MEKLVRKTIGMILILVVFVNASFASASTVSTSPSIIYSLLSASFTADGYRVVFKGLCYDKDSVSATTTYMYTPETRTATAYGYYYDSTGTTRTVSDAAGSGSSTTVSKVIYAPSGVKFYAARTAHRIYLPNGGSTSMDSGKIDL